MKRNTHILPLLAASLLALGMAACVDEPANKRQFSFDATTEQWQSTDAKVRLDDNEQWIYWELDDAISIGSNAAGQTATQGWLVAGGAEPDWTDFNGVFMAEMNEGSSYFLGLHPYNEHNVISYMSGSNDKHHFDAAKLWLNNVQTYRTDERADHTFDRQVLPMVAWHGKDWVDDNTQPKLDFHTLAGLVRLQFYNQSGSNQEIKSITIEALNPAGLVTDDALEVANQDICGLFVVQEQHTANPYLKFESNTAGGETYSNTHTITLRCADDAATIPFAQGELKSFYVVLPAMWAGSGAQGENRSTVYKLQVTVTNAAGQQFSRTISKVRVRRRGITYMQALGITAFADAPANGNGSAGLVGNGTEERPFKIYTAADMLYLQTCFSKDNESDPVYVNGQQVDATTQFRIMRSDIVLPDDWQGIKHFRGHLRYAATNNSHPGITNNTLRPLFISVTQDGTVEDLTVRYDYTGSELALNLYIDEGTAYTPFCQTNSGTLRGCAVTHVSGSKAVNISSTVGSYNYGGICINNTNEGRIEHCENTSTVAFSTAISVGGVVYENHGTVSECNITSAAQLTAAAAIGGIVYNNYGTVEDCYNAANISNIGATPWGGIVYHNEGTVKHCAFMQQAKLTTANSSQEVRVGGIVCENTGSGSLVDYCYCDGTIGSSTLGGIVHTLGGGTVRNCYVYDVGHTFTVVERGVEHAAGGLVATMSGGTLENSFCALSEISVEVEDHQAVRGVVVGTLTGGTVDNCYGFSLNSNITPFYGSKTGGSVTHSHLVGTTTTPDDVTYTWTYDDNATTGLAKLQEALTANKPANGADWLKATGTQGLPYLKPYTKPATTAHRRRHR